MTIRRLIYFIAVFVIISRSSDACAQETASFTNLDARTFATFFLTNAFDLNKPFSGLVDVYFTDNELVKMSAGVSCQDGNLRAYMDMDSLETGLPPEIAKSALQTQKKAGLGRYIVIMKKGDSTRYTLYPDRHTYHTNDFWSLTPSFNVAKPITLKRVQAGQETIEGHACRREEWHISEGPDQTVLVVLWRARDMGGFPMKIKFGEFMRIIFKKMKFEKLDPALFEIPAGYKCLDSIQAIAAEALPQSAASPKADTKTNAAARVLKWQQDLAEDGDVYGEYQMGLRYRDGDGVPKDLDKARDYLEKAAEQGNKDATRALAKLPPADRKRVDSLSDSAPDVSSVSIQRAEFGAGKNFADVTERVVELLRTAPEGFTADGKTLEADPLPGKKKQLKIRYNYKGADHTLTVPGAKQVSLQALVKNASK